VPNSIENAKSDVADKTLRGISEVVNRRGAMLTGAKVSKGGLERRQMLVGLEAPEALLGFQHARGSPAQSHLRVPPALYIRARLANYAVRVLYDFDAGQRTA